MIDVQSKEQIAIQQNRITKNANFKHQKRSYEKNTALRISYVCSICY